jgi:UDP-N-acetylglucosamine--N-acetylmuramyl-(pentapeptide) pyrophosphoryl-undecaprenol N-acetylglucosamine transferase
MKKIVVTGGGTGGHLFAAIAAGEELMRLGFDVHLITDLRCKNYLSPGLKLTTHIVDFRIYGGLIGKITGALKLLKATAKSIIALRDIKPDMVIGFGGYPSFPILLGALATFTPIVVHEQNCFLGKTNAFFARFAKIIALSYPETKNINLANPKIVITGSMIRGKIKTIPKRHLETNNKNFTILIFGGSQGAKLFSILIPAALIRLKSICPEIELKVIQQTSIEDIESLHSAYTKGGIKAELAPFFHNMHELYNQADLVISRAGASTLAELTYLGMPAILIPYPYASDNHQFYNAKALENDGGAWCIEQKELTEQKLSDKIHYLIKNRDKLVEASAKLQNRNSDGAAVLANTVNKFLG